MSVAAHLYRLKTSLLAPLLDRDLILCRFYEVVNNSPPTTIRLAVELILETQHSLIFNNNFLRILKRAMPQDHLQDERLRILAHVPKLLWSYAEFSKIVANRVSDIIMEGDSERYKKAKTNFGEFVISFAATCRNTSFDNLITDDDRIECLIYLGMELKPDPTPWFLQTSNDAFSIMAKRVNLENFKKFWKAVMTSDYYEYYGLMAALSVPANQGVLEMFNALEFLIFKRGTMDNEAIGLVEEDLKTTILVEFTLSILNRLSVFKIQFFMKQLEQNCFVPDYLLAEIAKRHMVQLDMERQIAPDNHGLIFFSRQSVLTKFYSGYNNTVLQQLLRFVHFEPHMNEFQRQVYYSCLATMSHPRVRTDHPGDLHLFRLLFRRLLALLPPMNRDDMEIEFNSYQTVLYCLYNLYRIDNRWKAVMTGIDPQWHRKIAHATDLHIVTSGNMSYNMQREEDRFRRKQIQRMQNTVTTSGQLLVFLFGRLNDIVLNVAPSYLSSLEFFDEDLFTDSFTQLFMIPLSKTQTKPGRRFTFPHRMRSVQQNDDNDSDEDYDTNEDSASSSNEYDTEDYDEDGDYGGNSETDSEINCDNESCSETSMASEDMSDRMSEYTIGSTDDEDYSDFDSSDDSNAQMYSDTHGSIAEPSPAVLPLLNISRNALLRGEFQMIERIQLALNMPEEYVPFDRFVIDVQGSSDEFDADATYSDEESDEWNVESDISSDDDSDDDEFDMLGSVPAA